MAQQNSQKHPSDAQIIARLRRSSNARTAKELGTTSARLRGIEGVVEVGRRPNMKHGKAVAGRPAVLFALEETNEGRSDLVSNGADPSAESRDGSLGAQDVGEREEA
jgi:hypothetical protein